MASRLPSSGVTWPCSAVAARVPTNAAASHGRRGALRSCPRTATSSAARAASASPPSGSSEPSAMRAAIQRQVGHSAAVCSAIHARAGARSRRMAAGSRRGERVGKVMDMI